MPSNSQFLKAAKTSPSQSMISNSLLAVQWLVERVMTSERAVDLFSSVKYALLSINNILDKIMT